MSAYTVQTGQLERNDSTTVYESSCTAIHEPRRFGPESRKGQLLLLVESVQTDQADNACQLVLRTAARAFYADHSYSITASLREAIRAANEALHKANFNAPPQRRVQVGLTCAVIKDDDLFLAQVAPSQAYIRTGAQVRALPLPPTWRGAAHLSATPFVQPSPLGNSLFSDPELFRCRWQPTGALLLCSSLLASQLSLSDVEALLSLNTPTLILEQLDALCVTNDLPDMRALAVVLQPQQRSQPDTRTARTAAVSDLLPFWQRWRNRLSGEPSNNTPIPSSPTSSTPSETAPVTEPPSLVPLSVPKTQSIDLGESAQTQYRRAREASQIQRPTFRSETIDLRDPTSTVVAQPYQPRHARRPVVDMGLGERLLLPLRWISNRWQTDRQRQKLRERQTVRRKRSANASMQQMRLNFRTEEEKPKRRFPLMFLVAIGLLVALLIVYGSSLAQQDAEDRTDAYLTQAELRLDAVFTAPDTQAALDELESFEQAMEEVQNSPLVTDTNAGFWLRYKDLQNDYAEVRASLYQISYLDDITILAEHPETAGRFARLVVPPATIPTTETVSLDALNYLYALDGNSDAAQLYQLPLTGGTAVPLLSPNDVVGSTVAGPLQATAWRLDNIVALDRGNNGFGYFFREGDVWNYVRMGGSEIWSPSGRIDLETYQGNLYVWGAEPNEILKFSSGRYGDIPELWINPSELQRYDISAAIDMAIDGRIYLLQPGGSVLVMNGGLVEREIIPGDIQPPITAVTRFVITGAPDTGSIFLLDTLNERVIQIDKLTGAVVQQLQAASDGSLRLNQLTDLYVDTTRGQPQLYLVNGHQLIRVPLNSPPLPFEELRVSAQ